MSDIQEIQEIADALVEALRPEATKHTETPTLATYKALAAPYIRASLLASGEQAGDSGPDGRTKRYRVEGTLWDVSEGEKSGEDVATCDAEIVSGVDGVIDTIAGWMLELFDGDASAMPEQATPAAIINRTPSLRSMLTRGGGEAAFRIRFSLYEDEHYLFVAQVERLDD